MVMKRWSMTHRPQYFILPCGQRRPGNQRASKWAPPPRCTTRTPTRKSIPRSKRREWPKGRRIGGRTTSWFGWTPQKRASTPLQIHEHSSVQPRHRQSPTINDSKSCKLISCFRIPNSKLSSIQCSAPLIDDQIYSKRRKKDRGHSRTFDPPSKVWERI